MGTTTTDTTGAAPAPKAAAEHVPDVEKVEVSSLAFSHGGRLPARYTCGGANVSPPLKWSGIPANTSELMVDVLSIEPVNGKLFFAWAVAGLSPRSHGIAAGKLPPNAVEGVNSTGSTEYGVCPPRGKHEKYVVVVFALPHSLGLKKGFNAVTAREQAVHDAEYEGFLLFFYERS
jgi:phosphatidylethanolamine-binding protein (PEBP) family uncharacterized protein